MEFEGLKARLRTLENLSNDNNQEISRNCLRLKSLESNCLKFQNSICDRDVDVDRLTQLTLKTERDIQLLKDISLELVESIEEMSTKTKAMAERNEKFEQELRTLHDKYQHYENELESMKQIGNTLNATMGRMELDSAIMKEQFNQQGQTVDIPPDLEDRLTEAVKILVAQEIWNSLDSVHNEHAKQLHQVDDRNLKLQKKMEESVEVLRSLLTSETKEKEAYCHRINQMEEKNFYLEKRIDAMTNIIIKLDPSNIPDQPITVVAKNVSKNSTTDVGSKKFSHKKVSQSDVSFGKKDNLSDLSSGTKSGSSDVSSCSGVKPCQVPVECKSSDSFPVKSSDDILNPDLTLPEDFVKVESVDVSSSKLLLSSTNPADVAQSQKLDMKNSEPSSPPSSWEDLVDVEDDLVKDLNEDDLDEDLDEEQNSLSDITELPREVSNITDLPREMSNKNANLESAKRHMEQGDGGDAQSPKEQGEDGVAPKGLDSGSSTNSSSSTRMQNHAVSTTKPASPVGPIIKLISSSIMVPTFKPTSASPMGSASPKAPNFKATSASPAGSASPAVPNFKTTSASPAGSASPVKPSPVGSPLLLPYGSSSDRTMPTTPNPFPHAPFNPLAYPPFTQQAFQQPALHPHMYTGMPLFHPQMQMQMPNGQFLPPGGQFIQPGGQFVQPGGQFLAGRFMHAPQLAKQT